mmetsp:Transcript_10398/g.33205  ORF Transcript_10398/g.33205 Transcript_10398/m.33205 type:complete len:202 (+) Transcript_10398:1692-2297(+)
MSRTPSEPHFKRATYRINVQGPPIALHYLELGIHFGHSASSAEQRGHQARSRYAFNQVPAVLRTLHKAAVVAAEEHRDPRVVGVQMDDAVFFRALLEHFDELIRVAWLPALQSDNHGIRLHVLVPLGRRIAQAGSTPGAGHGSQVLSSKEVHRWGQVFVLALSAKQSLLLPATEEPQRGCNTGGESDKKGNDPGNDAALPA